MDPKTSGTPLAGDFAVLAIVMSPESVEADRGTFSDVKRARGRLNHGSVTDIDALPFAELKELSDRYLGRALSTPALFVGG
jgi:hypothetical protein